MKTIDVNLNKKELRIIENSLVTWKIHLKDIIRQKRSLLKNDEWKINKVEKEIELQKEQIKIHGEVLEKIDSASHLLTLEGSL